MSCSIIPKGTATMCSYAMEDCISLHARKNMVVSTILRRGWSVKAKAIFATADLRLVHVYPKDGELGRRSGCCQPNPFMAVGPIQGKLTFLSMWGTVKLSFIFLCIPKLIIIRYKHKKPSSQKFSKLPTN